MDRMVIKAKGEKNMRKAQDSMYLFFVKMNVNENKIKRHVHLLIQKLLCS